MLELDNVLIRQGDFTLGADLVIAAGDIVAVMGPSGAGKSTLLNAIAGFIDPEAGEMRWQGARFDTVPPAQRPVTMLFQDGNLFPHMSAGQNVGLALSHRARLTAAEREKVHAALARVGLDGMDDRKPAALSGGQQSRVALARALLMDRPVLLLDEPFAALGPALKREMLDLVAELAREAGTTVLMVSHDPGDARHIADAIVVVDEGRAHPPGDTATLLDDPPRALRDYLGRE